MKTGQQYLDSLNDGRVTYFEGRRVERLLDEPVLARGATLVAETYDRYYSPEPNAVNPLMLRPDSVDGLRRSAEEINHADELASATYHVLQGLHTSSSRMPAPMQTYRDRIEAFTQQILHNDLRMSEGITDAKGNRSLPPGKQDDPDAYVRVVGRDSNGVIIRGAKLHIGGAAHGHVIMVMPTKAMKSNEAEYSIACAVDVNAEGVHIISVTPAPRVPDDRHFPISRQGRLTQCFVILDNVFVPHERVFLDGENEHAATFVHSLGLWSRMASILSTAEDADRLVGFAHLIAEANGISRVPHIREKIAELIINATLIRAGAEAAIYHAMVLEDGSVIPDELYTNAAKYHAAASHNLMLRHLHDIAGGSVITAPSLADLDNPQLSGYLEKYMAGGADIAGEYRLRLFHAIRDYTADAHGGWQMVENLHGSGGLVAQQLVSTKHYDIERARALALRAASMSD